MTSFSTSAALSSSKDLGRSAGVPRRVLLTITATLVVAAAAHVAFRLPFTPVPFTLQPLAVLGVGLALGPTGGALAMLAYLLEGALGLPVFSPTGPGGLLQLLGPTGGYLLAYPAVAFVAGWVTGRLRPWAGEFAAALLACTLATSILFLSGAAWLAYEAHLSTQGVFFAAIAPFLPGEGVKILAAAGVYRALQQPFRR